VRLQGGARGKTEDARTLEKHMMAERRNAPKMRGAQTEKSFWSSVCSVVKRLSDRHRFCKALSALSAIDSRRTGTSTCAPDPRRGSAMKRKVLVGMM